MPPKATSADAPRPQPPRHGGAHTRAPALSFVEHEGIDAMLAPVIPDERDRALVVRCLLDEGPAHHRGANWVLLQLLGRLAGPLAPVTEGIPVPMRLPPDVQGNTDARYALRLPLRPLEELADRGSPAMDAMIDCLLDGPPQHALGNVAMLIVIDALLRRRDSAAAATTRA